MASLIRNDRKYWPRVAGVIASSTLIVRRSRSRLKRRRCTSPDVLVVGFHPNHAPYREYKALEGNVVLVLYDDHNFVKVPLRRVCDLFHNDMMGCAYQNEFVGYGHDGARNVFVQSWMSGLVDWRIILFPSYE